MAPTTRNRTVRYVATGQAVSPCPFPCDICRAAGRQMPLHPSRVRERMTMATEFEAKALDIDVAAISAAIRHHGGQHVSARMMRRYVYDIVPGDKSKWIRLRQDGDEATLCVKQILSDEIDGTREVEVSVSDFDETHALLRVVGFEAKAYQENHRTSYLLGSVRLEIDSWPLIPPYLEIEGDSVDEVQQTAKLLGLDPDSLTSVNTTDVYARYGHDLATFKELRFIS